MKAIKDIKGGDALKQFALEDLKRMQAMPLEDKIARTKLLIKEWYEFFNGKVAISFSGGKDSTVLLTIARQIYPDIPAMFCDTGLEYPEIREHVKTFDNVTWVKPKKTFKQVVLEYGYPLVSKEVSRKVHDVRHSKSQAMINLRLTGIRKTGTESKKSILSHKWRFLIDAPFEVSDRCCYFLKKSLSTRYSNETGNHMIVATMAEESSLRMIDWIRHGCNAFTASTPKGKPMSFWTEQDVLQYIRQYNIPIAKVYGDVIENEDGTLKCSGVHRTGCMFCMYGLQFEKSPNRFEKMKETHPKQYEWCMRDVEQGGLGLGKVLDYMKLPH